MAALKNQITTGIGNVIEHCQAAQTTFTTSDFPLVKAPQETIDRLTEAYPGIENILPLTPLQQGILFHSLEIAGAYQVQFQFPGRRELRR